MVYKKGKEVLRKARKIAVETQEIVDNDSYLSVLARNSLPLIERKVKKDG